MTPNNFMEDLKILATLLNDMCDSMSQLSFNGIVQSSDPVELYFMLVIKSFEEKYKNKDFKTLKNDKIFRQDYYLYKIVKTMAYLNNYKI